MRMKGTVKDLCDVGRVQDFVRVPHWGKTVGGYLLRIETIPDKPDYRYVRLDVPLSATGKAQMRICLHLEDEVDLH